MGSRYVIAALCVILVVAPIAAVGPASGDNGSTNVGSLEVDDGRTGVTTTGTDLGTAFHGEADTLRSELAVASLETRLDRAEDSADRRTAVQAEVDRLEKRLARYREGRKTAGKEFAAGERSAHSLALTLARTDGDAARIRAERASIQSMVADRDDVSLANGLDSAIGSRSGIEGEALALEGPIRGRLRQDAVTGDRATVILTANGDGVAASDVQSGTFRREVTRWDNHFTTGANVFRHADGGPVSAAYDRAKADFYPTAYDRAIASGSNNPSILTYGDSIYRVTFPFDGGRIRAFIDGNTTNPFRELQRRSIENLDASPVANGSGDGLVVTVNRTFPGGPLSVDVTDSTGSPVEATVSIENRTVGRTDAEGQLWTVDPLVATTVSVRTDDGRTVDVGLPPADRSESDS